MSRAPRRHYRKTLRCPECGHDQFFLTADGSRSGCVDCFALDGLVVEPVLMMSTDPAGPRFREARLCGISLPSPLRKTRSR